MYEGGDIVEKYFPKNIKFLKDKYNYSTLELADKLHVSQSTVSRWMNDVMGATFDNAWDISKLFNIPLDKLYGTDLSKSDDEFNDYFEANKHLLIDEDKEYIKFLIERRKKQTK